MKLVKDNINEKLKITEKVSDEEAEKAFRTVLSWIGEDPSREGLIDTPKRVVKAFKEYLQ
jgi:GTP cyclohydrolase I